MKNNKISEFKKYCQDNQITPLKSENKRVLSVFNHPKKISSNHSQIDVTKSILLSEYSLNQQYSDYDSDIVLPTQFCNNGQNLLMRELAKPGVSVDIELDFHGYTANEALLELQRVILCCPSKVVMRIIHGKGLNSNNNKPVLKNVVRRFLMRNIRVLAYTAAHINLGGDGATCCCFRAQK